MISNRPSHKLPKLSASFALLMLLASCLAGCAGQPLTALPPQLVGEWRTAEGRYQGRFMRVETDRITFGMGGAGPDKLERVQNVRVFKADSGQEFRINLVAADGSPDPLVLDFSKANGGELHLKSQPNIVWTTGKLSPHAAPAAPPSTSQPPQTHALTPLTGNDHKTIYRIDCLQPNVCKSY
jgi:hypothetical protein